jgi:hypothetical protein
MDHGHFDDLTRSAVRDDGTRRAVLRLLAGGAFGSLVARLGLSETTEAKPKRHKSKPKPKRNTQAERKAHGQLQAEGKRKGKKHNRKRPEPTPPADPTCSLDKYPCPDGTCVPWGACCAGEKRCNNKSCIPFHNCCPDEKPCGDIDCVPRDECCPDDPAPLCDLCEEVVCEDGELVCRANAGVSTCQPCPPGGSVCPRASGDRYPLPGGGFIDLPDGCCPSDKMATDPTTGHVFCNSHWGYFGYCAFGV